MQNICLIIGAGAGIGGNVAKVFAKNNYHVYLTRRSDENGLKKLIDEATIKCKKILSDHIKELHIVAKGLIEYETLTLEEVKDLIKGIQPSRDDFDNDSSPESKITPSVPKTGNTAAPQAN